MSWATHPSAKVAACKSPNRTAGQARKSAPRIDREGLEQKVLIRWLYAQHQNGMQVGQLLFGVVYHVPNGGKRNKKTAADLKMQGVRAGVSDLVVATARGGYHGVYIEFKAAPPHDAGLAKSQREWLEKMEANGYLAVLAKGVDEAKAVLVAYAIWPETVVAGEPEVMPHGSKWSRTNI
ncbi:VRR-NUC domain-containing protein [Cobetia amphilecti]|nr:VRR-NUC domain-containing protein [Cobetia litoralis]